ncbi:MAG: hypothetical protein M3N29_02675 [Chloroflexota bacterium]|nr:hypothetical protein [Chloroflexota bacterium]
MLRRRGAPRRGCLPALLALALTVALLYVAFLAFAPVRSAVRTVALVPELLNLPVRPLALLSPEPVRVSTTYGNPPDRIDIYVPGGASADRRLPAVLLALGVHPEEIDHPDIVRVASAISRLGVVVGVPDSTPLRELRVTPAEAGHLVDALFVLVSRPEVDPRRVGLAGFSAGASIALLAAADPRVATDLRFVSDFGGYADAETLLVDVATRSMVLDRETLDWQPDAGIRRDVARLLSEAIEPAAVRDELAPMLQAIAASADRPTTPDPAVAERLQADARAAYLLFTAPDRPAAEAAIALFSPRLRANLLGISPLTFAPRIRTNVFVLHGIGDTAIPVSHAYLIADALPKGAQARMTIFGRFAHGQPGQGGLSIDDAGDVLALTLYLHAIIAASTE